MCGNLDLDYLPENYHVLENTYWAEYGIQHQIVSNFNESNTTKTDATRTTAPFETNSRDALQAEPIAPYPVLICRHAHNNAL